MSDEVLAQARRLHMHVMNSGNVTAMDMSRLVQGMERMQAERDQLKTEAGIDEWCKQFERANRNLNDKLFALHERLEATEAERDRMREALREMVAAYPLDKFKDNGMRVSAHLEASATLGEDRP